MKKYTKIYLEEFDLLSDDNGVFVPSELSGDRAVDIHHIISRGIGGKNTIENLMALTREEHEEYGDIKYLIPMLLRIHKKVLEVNKIKFDKTWFKYYLNKYKHYEN